MGLFRWLLPLQFDENTLIWNSPADKLTTDQCLNGKKQLHVLLLLSVGKIKTHTENTLNFHLGLIIPVWNTNRKHTLTPLRVMMASDPQAHNK